MLVNDTEELIVKFAQRLPILGLWLIVIVHPKCLGNYLSQIDLPLAIGVVTVFLHFFGHFQPFDCKTPSSTLIKGSRCSGLQILQHGTLPFEDWLGRWGFGITRVFFVWWWESLWSQLQLLFVNYCLWAKPTLSVFLDWVFGQGVSEISWVGLLQFESLF